MEKFSVCLLVLMIIGTVSFSQDNSRKADEYIVFRGLDSEGREYVKVIVPGKPPEHYRSEAAVISRSAVMLTDVPAFSWCFGCSATSASMMAGYYDNNGYPDMYTGPTNWGLVPMDNSVWGTMKINDEPRDFCPLSATRMYLDGRSTRGHVDDYWISYGNGADDPYITNGWTEHSWEDCTGDFMGTNQSALGSSDGSTTFIYYVNGFPYSGTGLGDGCYGMKLFFESRGYTVTGYYSQYIYGYNGNTLGFTFEQYKNEIDNGRPVMIQVAGHSMVGVGYDPVGEIVYLHNTWDYSTYSMVWGSSYEGMEHYGVAVVQLAPAPQPILADFAASAASQLEYITVDLTDRSWGSPVSWNWTISPTTYAFVGGTSASSQNPQVQFTAAGWYTVTLAVSDGVNQDTETKLNAIEILDCDHFPFPLSEDFSEGALPNCWTIVDHIGNGQTWDFVNHNGWDIYTPTCLNGFIMMDSDYYGDGNSQNTDLVTPALDLSAYVSVNLSFYHYFKEWSGSSGTLSYSTDGGGSWTPIQSWTTETANAEHFDMDVTSLVAGNSEVMFKWNYTGSYGYFWVLDDIDITGTMPGLWTGSQSSSWNDASNWSTGQVPGNTVDITVPAKAENWPVYTGNLVLGTNCRDIILYGVSRLSVTGNLNIPAGRTVQIMANGQLKVGGTLLNQGMIIGDVKVD